MEMRKEENKNNKTKLLIMVKFTCKLIIHYIICYLFAFGLFRYIPELISGIGYYLNINNHPTILAFFIPLVESIIWFIFMFILIKFKLSDNKMIKCVQLLSIVGFIILSIITHDHTGTILYIGDNNIDQNLLGLNRAVLWYATLMLVVFVNDPMPLIQRVGVFILGGIVGGVLWHMLCYVG